MGLFDNVFSLQGTEEDKYTAGKMLQGEYPPGAVGSAWAAVNSAAQVLPAGSEWRKWLTANPIKLVQNIIELIKGRTYTRGDYTLAERYNDQILCNKGIDQTQATDEMVETAHIVFNVLFGVRITTDDDLSALQNGIAAYKARPAAAGISDQAINRAVYLKRTYYPSSTYNVTCWDMSWFAKYPLVAPIPAYEPGRWYTGPLPGGGNAVNGVIPVSARSVISQVMGASVNATTGQYSNLPAVLSGMPSFLQKQPAIIALLIVAGFIISVRLKLFKP